MGIFAKLPNFCDLLVCVLGDFCNIKNHRNAYDEVSERIFPQMKLIQSREDNIQGFCVFNPVYQLH